MAKRRSTKNKFEHIFLLILGSGLVLWGLGQSIAQNLKLEDYILVFFALIFLTAILGVSILVAIESRKKKRVKAIKVSQIDSMSGVEFEKYVGALLGFQGYRISFTKTSGDYGVDIIASKNREKIAVQVKRYRKFVGRSAISDAVAGMAYYGCTSSMVVTNSSFSRGAIELAKSNKCVLIDRSRLTDWMISFSQI